MRKILGIATKDEILEKALDIARQYPTSLWGGFKNRKLFEDVETYCMFLGYPRSGKTLISSLLDAHPNIIMADELSVLKYIYVGFSRRQIFYLLLENSRSFTKAGRISKMHSHRIPNQWQGKFNKLQIIGDNKGGGSCLWLRKSPGLLKRLRDIIGVNIKVLHVIRNPYDNISSISKSLNMNLMESIKFYFSLCKTVFDTKKQLNRDELFEVRHESFIDAPNNYLKKICSFLCTDVPEDYLNDCASIVFKSPRKTRYNAQWNSELIDIVKEGMHEFSFLECYSYED